VVKTLGDIVHRVLKLKLKKQRAALLTDEIRMPGHSGVSLTSIQHLRIPVPQPSDVRVASLIATGKLGRHAKPSIQAVEAAFMSLIDPPLCSSFGDTATDRATGLSPRREKQF